MYTDSWWDHNMCNIFLIEKLLRLLLTFKFPENWKLKKKTTLRILEMTMQTPAFQTGSYLLLHVCQIRYAPVTWP